MPKKDYVVVRNGKSQSYTPDEFNDPEMQSWLGSTEGVEAYELSEYRKKDQTLDGDSFRVYTPDGKSQDYSREDFEGQEMQDWLKTKRNYRVMRVRPAGPNIDRAAASQRLSGIYDRINEIDTELGTLPQEADIQVASDPRAIQGKSVAAMQQAEQARRNSPDSVRSRELRKEREELIKERSNNPMWKQYWQSMGEGIGESAAGVERMQSELDKANPKSAGIYNGLRLSDREGLEAGTLAADSKANPEYYRDKAALDSANYFYREAKKVASAPSKYGDEKGTENFWRGIMDEGFSAISVVGAAESMNNIPLIKAVKKIQDNLGAETDIRELMRKPEKVDFLSDAEKEMLKAFLIRAEVESGRSEDLSKGYQAGKSFAQSLGFMTDFMLMGGLGDAVADKAVGKVVERAAENAVAKGASKTLETIGADALHGLVKAMAMSPMMPSTYSNILNTITQLNENGNIDLSTHAIRTAIEDSLIENVSETIGAKPLELFGFGMSKVLPKDWLTKVGFGTWAKAMTNSGFASVMKKAGYNGFIEEMFEEVTGNALRAIPVVGTDPNALKDFFKGENLLITAASFAPLAALGLPMSTMQFAHSSNMLSASEENIKRYLAEQGVDQRTIDGIVNKAREFETPERLGDYMSNVFLDLVESGKDPKKAYELVNDYTTNLSTFKVMTDMYEGEKDIERTDRILKIDAQLGKENWKHSDKKGNSFVRTLTSEDGKTYYVVGEGDGEIITMDEAGTPFYVKQENLGQYTDSGEMSLNKYLDDVNDAEKNAEEAQQMRWEAQSAQDRFDQNIAEKKPIDMGTSEAPMVGELLTEIDPNTGAEIPVRQPTGDYVVVTPDGVQHLVSEEDLASKWGIQLQPKTQDQKDADRIAEREAAHKRKMVYNRIPIGSEVEATLEGIEEPVKYNFVRAKYNEAEDGLDIVVTDMETGEEITLPEEAFPDLSMAASEVSETIAPTEEVPVDDAPRDSKGEPLPMRTAADGTQKVDEQKLWKEKPEEWVLYNDGKPNRIVDSKSKVESAIKTISAQNEEAKSMLQQEMMGAMDQDKIDEYEKVISDNNGLLSRYNGILEDIESRENAAKEAAKAAEKAAKEQANAQEAEAPAEAKETLSPEQEQAFAEEERRVPLRARANEWVSKTGVEVALLESVDEVENQEARDAINKGEQVKGWFDKNTGKVYLYMPGLEDEADVDKTYIHEVISHKGLQDMLGAFYPSLLDKVWSDVMSEADRKKFTNYIKKTNSKASGDALRRAAADEYIADLSEHLDIEENKTAWEKFVMAVRSFLIKMVTGGIRVTNEDLSELLQASMSRYRDMVTKGEAAPVMRRKARLNNDGIASSGDETRFSVKYAPKSAEEADQIASDIAEETGVSKKNAAAWVKSETSLAAVIEQKENQPYLDYTADDRYDAIKENSDYPQGTVDFNNICRKRIAFTEMYQRLQKAFPNVIITGEDLAQIRNIMKSHGLTVACGLCYVEDRRQLLGEIAKDFIDNYATGFADYASRGGETKKKNARKFIDLIGEDRKDDLSIYDLITLAGSSKLYQEHPGIYAAFQAFNNARGQQSGNLFQGYAEYKREILKWTKSHIKKVNDNGGLRIFSYSDFEAHHLIDLVQVIQDCARKGVKIQGYTKVPAFARAVANTGVKLNRSLIPLGDTGIVDGKLAYDTIEGIDPNDPNFLESNDNVGNILVGINDEQIRLAMADPFIHYIIPYHSNQKEVLRTMKQTGAWTNYKSSQNEKDASGKTTLVNIYTDVIAAAEAEGKPIKNEKQFTEKFLQVCKEKGLTPRFEQFLDKKNGEYVYTPGYYKLLLDFKMFDENGKYLPQTAVVAKFDDAFNKQLLDEYVAGEKEKFDGDLDDVYNEIVNELGLEDRADVKKQGEKMLGDILAAIGKNAEGKEGGMTDEAKARKAEYEKEKEEVDNIRFRTVYHGSGADFEAFDHSHMGEGEGAQMAGYGTYVTTNPETGKEYATRFAKDGERHLYTVEIPDDDGENYLHWDEPITNRQSKKIMDAVRKLADKSEWGSEFEYELKSSLGPGTYGRFVDSGLDYFLGNEMNYATGEDPGAKRNSELLSSLGIVGMEYPFERGNYDETHYVIYNEKDLKIKENLRFRITPEQDKEYMDAVEAGDMEKAGKMVESAARSAGYDSPKLYHGTDEFGFTKIDLRYSDDGLSFWATSRPDIAGSYAASGEEVRRISDKDAGRDDAMKAMRNLDEKIHNFRSLIDRHFSEWFFGRQDDSVVAIPVYNANAIPGNGDGVYDALLDFVVEAYDRYGDEQKGSYDSFDDWQENSEEWKEIEEAIIDVEGAKSAFADIDLNNISSGLYEFFANLDNTIEVDAKGAIWNGIRPDIDELNYGPYSTRDIADWAKEKGYSGVVFKNVLDNGNYGRTPAGDVYAFFNPQAQIKSADPVTYDDDGNVIPLSERFNPQSSDIRFRMTPAEAEEESVRFRVVDDPLKVAELEAKPKVKVYRSMQEIDGKLYPPMSARVEGELRQPTELGVWEESEERPELADEDGNFKLDKGNKKSLKAAYAPYFHTRRSPLNEQFSEAYNRPNLVIVEGEIPESELTSGYTAEKSKKSVGEHDWPSGKVSNALAKKGQDTRKVILSRWFKPVRVVPNSEVADMIMERLGDSNIAFPNNVVTPGLREELKKRGAKFSGWQGNKPENVDEIIANMQKDDEKSAKKELTEAQKKVIEFVTGKPVESKDNGIRFSIRGIEGVKNAEDAVALANLDTAEEMEKEGKDNRTIWLATGWERGADGKWRNEIPDAKIKEDVGLTRTNWADRIIDAPELFESYPQLKEMPINFMDLPEGTRGQYNRQDRTIAMNTKDTTRKDEESGKYYLTENGLSVLLHELQHAIQHIEGFAPGGSYFGLALEYFQKARKEDAALADYAKIIASNPRNTQKSLVELGPERIVRDGEAAKQKMNSDSAKKIIDGIIDRVKDMSASEYKKFVKDAKRIAKEAEEEAQKYLRLAGEVEARNVQTRNYLSEELRKEMPLSTSESVRRKDQVVRMEEANAQQKLPVREEMDQEMARLEEPEIMFRLSNNNRTTIESWLKKRNDISDEQREAVVNYIDGLEDSKMQLATGRWYSNGTIRLPEDMDKVKQAVSVAGKAKVDPLQYASPMALLDAHANFKPTAERINPDNVPTLHKADEYPADGVVVYDVDEGEESRKNMRQIINTHFGEDASPWCLLQGDGKGNLTKDSKKYWNHYNSYPKQVAFKDGKLLAFSANDSGVKVWWDRQDTSHYGIPITKKIDGDELGRSVIHILQDEAIVDKDLLERELAQKYNCPPYAIRAYASADDIARLDEAQERVNENYRNGGNIRFVPEPGSHPFKGNRQNGHYEEWTSDGSQILERTDYKDGKADGIHETWYPNGQQNEKITMKNDSYVGPVTIWYDNGQVRLEANFDEDSKKDGKQEAWFKNGNKRYEVEYSHGQLVGERKEWREDGTVMSVYKYDDTGELQAYEEYWPYGLDRRVSYPNDHDRIEEKFYRSGQLASRETMHDGKLEGLQEYYYTDGTIKERVNYHDGEWDGLREKYHPNGQLWSRGEYKAGKKDGVHESWSRDGVLNTRTEFKEDEVVDGSPLDHLRFRISNASQKIFISNAEAALDKIKMEKATPEQWIKMLEKEGGLKAAEDKWLGLSDWLNGIDRKTVEKAEISEFIKKNQIQIEEQHYSEDVDAVKAAQEDASNSIVGGKSIEELQAEIDELKESPQRYDFIGQNPTEMEMDNFLMDAMKEEYGDDFEVAYSIMDGIVESSVGGFDFDEDDYAAQMGGVRPINSTRKNYTTEGLRNLHEIALTVPTIEQWNTDDQIHFGDAGEGRAISWIRFGDTWTSSAKDEAEKKYREADQAFRDYRNEIVNKYALKATGTKTTKDLATDEENKKVKELQLEAARLYQEWMYGQHQREKVLVIDEIQSKRHQEAREQGGYKDDSALKRAEARRDAAKEEYDRYYKSILAKYGDFKGVGENMTPEESAESQRLYSAFRDAENAVARNGFDPMADEEYRRLREEQYAHEHSAEFQQLMEDWKNAEGPDAMQDINEKLKPFQQRNRELLEAMENRERILANEFNATHKSKIPAAPFEKNWPELSMKRMLRYAAEYGYDTIAWTTGEQQADRYDLGGVLESIDAYGWEDASDYTFDNDDVEGDVKRVTMSLDNQEDVDVFVNRDGVVVDAGEYDQDFLGRHLDEIVGKELAKKIMAADEEVEISGDGLRIGGEGMKGFYDDILPRWMNKYGKKWGVKVEDIFLPALGTDAEAGAQKGLTMHSVKVTPEMKESVMEGQLMFRLAPNGKESNLTDEQYDLVRTPQFKKWFGDWEIVARAKAILGLNPEKLVPMPTNKTPKEVYKGLRKGENKNDGTKVEFFTSAYKKVTKLGGISEKIIATLPNIFDNSVLAYTESDNLEGQVRPDGTTHKAHPNIEEVRNYVGKVSVDGKDYYVRFTVNMQRNNDGVHSYFATDIDLYTTNPASSLSYPNLLGARVTDDGIVDTKLETFFKNAREEEKKVSKVVDENGEPLVMYHGTGISPKKGPFYVFNTSKQMGAHFGTKEQAETRARYKALTTATEPYVYNAFLNIRNPLYMKDAFDFDASLDIANALEKDGVLSHNEAEDSYTADRLRRHLIEKGYDGIVYENEIEGNGLSYIVFNPSQIKSATDNNGDFDPANPDIRFRITPEFSTAADLVERYENQDGEEYPWMSQGELISAVENNIERDDATDHLFELLDRYHDLEEENFAEGKRDFVGGEMDDLFNEILDELRNLEPVETEEAETKFKIGDPVVIPGPTAEELITKVQNSGLPGILEKDEVDDYFRTAFTLMPESDRKAAAQDAIDKDLNFRRPVRDYIASLAAKGYANDETGFLRAMANRLEQLISTDQPISENQLLYMMWRDAKRYPKQDVLSLAQDISLRKRLGIGEFVNQFPGQAEAVEQQAEKNVDVADKARSEDRKAAIREVKEGKAPYEAINKAMGAQRQYDRATVDGVVDLAKQMIKEGNINGVTAREMARLMTIIKSTNGRRPETVKNCCKQLMDFMVDHTLQTEEDLLAKMLKVKTAKVKEPGVDVQAKLDVRAQGIINTFKEYMGREENDIREAIDERMDKLSDDRTSETRKEELQAELDGLSIALQYCTEIAQNEAENTGIRDGLKAARADYKDLPEEEQKRFAKALQEQTEASYDMIRKNKIDRVNAYRDLRAALGEAIAEGAERAKTFLEKERERVAQIHHEANSDMQGVDDNPIEPKVKGIGKVVNNGVARLLTSPLATFDQMLRLLGRKHPNGQGYLWNRYMGQLRDANDNEKLGLDKANDELNAKVQEIFGDKTMTWNDLYNLEKGMGKATIRFFNANGKWVEEELSAGNLLYIYMVDKMADGRMKLRQMGINEEDVRAIKDSLDPRFIQLADWIQEEFLTKLRDKYNEVHQRLFGTSMAAIDNYFPLRILGGVIREEIDLSNPDSNVLPSAMTGSIIKRTVNRKQLDITGTDAFSLVIEHIQEMEHWAAFAELNRDLGTLLSYKRFQNQMKHMTTIYGAGKELWGRFKNTAILAAHEYRPARTPLDTAAINLAKGVSTAKISFRAYTAIKQILSWPAFLADANIAQLAKYTAPWSWRSNWKWAMENLPNFKKRVESRTVGNEKLDPDELDSKFWGTDFAKWIGRNGMSMNAFVDALTVSIGSRAMYETKKAQYLSEGYDEARADKKARFDATTLFNETQQSSEKEFMSTMQADRTVVSVALSVYRNSSFGYQRQLHSALRTFSRLSKKGYKEESIEFMTKQLVRDGLSEDQAKEAAEKRYSKALGQAAVRAAVFGFLVEFAWNLGANAIYLLFGDDPDEKKQMLEEDAMKALSGGLVEGLAGGSIISDLLSKFEQGESVYGYDMNTLPIMQDVKNTIAHFGTDPVAAANELVFLGIQIGLGTNPQTFSDAIVAIIDACNGDFETAKEVELLIMRILQVPQSQLDQLMIDEIDMTAGDAKKLSYEEVAQRYVDYKMRRNAPLTGIAYPEELRAKREKSLKTTFKKKYNQRAKLKEQE